MAVCAVEEANRRRSGRSGAIHGVIAFVDGFRLREGWRGHAITVQGSLGRLSRSGRGGPHAQAMLRMPPVALRAPTVHRYVIAVSVNYVPMLDHVGFLTDSAAHRSPHISQTLVRAPLSQITEPQRVQTYWSVG